MSFELKDETFSLPFAFLYHLLHDGNDPKHHVRKQEPSASADRPDFIIYQSLNLLCHPYGFPTLFTKKRRQFFDSLKYL